MQKIILNKCFGGYGWSKEALLDYLERKGIQNIRFVKTYRINDSYKKADISKEEFLNKKDFSSYKDYKEIFVQGKDMPFDKDYYNTDPDEWYSVYGGNVDREDPVAIQLLEEKGSQYCSGDCAKLRLEEYDNEYWVAHINEYDGIESLKFEPLVTRKKIRECKNMEEVIQYLEKFKLFKYDKE